MLSNVNRGQVWPKQDVPQHGWTFFAGLAALAVSLADVFHPGGAVQVVEPSVVVKVSAVFVSGAEAVMHPAVGLTGFPAPGFRHTQVRVTKIKVVFVFS